MKNNALFLILFLLCSFTGAAQPLRVDLDLWDTQPARVNEPGSAAWAVGPAAPEASRTFGGITVTLSAAGNGNLMSHWNKAGIAEAKLVSDGVYVQHFSDEACIELRIKGLAPGRHSLMTFHNALDNPKSNTFSPMTVARNGEPVHESAAVPARVAKNEEALKLFTAFDVSAGEEVVFTFRADAGDATNKNVYLNAFEIDGPDMNKQAQFPLPVNADEHVDADTGSCALTWQPAPGVVSHDIYI